MLHPSAGTRGLCTEGTPRNENVFCSLEAKFLGRDVMYYGHLAIGEQDA
jgi:hypothetical protein